MQLGSLDSEKWFDIQGFANFTAARFVTKSSVTLCRLLFAKIAFLLLVLEIIFCQS